jgi:hypothetical protein
MSIAQKDNDGKAVKVNSYFWDNDNKCSINGMPVPTDRDSYDKDDWKIYFMQVKKFLKKHLIQEMANLLVSGNPPAASAPANPLVEDANTTDNQEGDEDLPF